MICPENEAELAGALHAAFDTSLVKLGSKQIDAVRPAKVIAPVSVDIADANTVRLFHYGTDPQTFLHVTLVLKRHAMSVHEGEIRDSGLEFGAHGDRLRRALPK